MKPTHAPKLTLFFALSLFVFALLLIMSTSDASPSEEAPPSQPPLTPVFAILTSEAKSDAEILPEAPHSESKSSVTDTDTDTKAKTTPPVIETLSPDKPFVTGLADTTKITPETAPPPPPLFVTGLADTPPIEVPKELPTADRESMIAAYIATAYRLDFPQTPDPTAKSLIAEIETKVKAAKASGVNTLFLQVRPRSDAFYPSKLFPSSRYLVKNEGDPLPLDVLDAFVSIAHREKMKLIAWINPYCVKDKGESPSLLSPQNPAVLHPDYTLSVNGALYYNPALQSVIDLIVRGVEEVVRNYRVDGILFDDYFYPEGVTAEDLLHYTAYTAEGGRLSLADWRRENVNSLIRQCYRAIKKIRPDCLFGVAPRGIWRNITEDASGSMTAGAAAYDSIFCDATAWVKEGTVDFLAPQLYWSYHEERAQFVNLALWWHALLENTDIMLIPSLAAWRLSEEEIRAQCFYLSALSHCHGWALYRMAYVP